MKKNVFNSLTIQKIHIYFKKKRKPLSFFQNILFFFFLDKIENNTSIHKSEN